MVFIKIGSPIEISPSNIQTLDSVIPAIGEEVLAEMKKYATELKRIAPKADDFLYFAAVMLHAAEASTINEDGTPKLTRQGEKVQAHWDTSNGTWRWVCNDPTIKSYKNSNGDIFPEVELIKAYKKWVGKPLCIDHKSSSVDHVRGFIVDTYYDLNLKRVVGLCALDKKNYPDLARKVETQYSNSVSMGTAVERAICYDCGTVARTEHDFCNHMRTKSGYGEINIGLNPMELSIVVNGADPAAKIKHVIAMANTLSAYVEAKEKELKKIAEDYSASINFTSSDEKEDLHVNIRAADLEELRQNINEAIDNYKKLELSSENEENIEKDTNQTAFNQSSSTFAMQESEIPGSDYSDAPPHARYASTEDLEKKLSFIKSSIENKLNKMQEDLNKLANIFALKGNKEENMSGNKDNMNKKGYFQGGGDVNEPTPGTKKYPVDPLQDDLRDSGDKQMVGQKPFPEVGAVDSLYPGNDSTSASSELERKKMLARAEADQRALRRAAAVSKAKEVIAYHNNGENDSNPNSPSLGKTKYKPDPTEVQLREKEDKQMVGQKPFPEVGSVDGLHPSPDSVEQRDELKRKEMLSRAGLNARFIKVVAQDGSLDKANSSWEVYNGDNLILSKTVDELTNGQAGLAYDGIATKAFAKNLMNQIKALGSEKVNELYKKAQAAPPAPAAVEDAPAPVEAPKAAVEFDAGAEGDPKQTALELAEKIQELSSDLVEAEKQVAGVASEMGDFSDLAPADVASADDELSSFATLNSLGLELSDGLRTALKEAKATLDLHKKELDSLVALHNKGKINASNNELFGSIIDDANSSAKEALAEAFSLLSGVVQFARGTDKLNKRAQKIAIKQVQKLNKRAHGDELVEQLENKEIIDMLGKTESELDELKDEFDHDHDHDDLVAELLADDLSAIEDDNNAVATSDPQQAVDLAKKNPSIEVELKSASTKEDRNLLRAKLAAEVKWNPLLDESVKLTDQPSFDVSSDAHGEVQNVKEVHDAMMEVFHNGGKVRKQAEEINKLVANGSLKEEDLDLLVANGVDAAAVKYYKDFYGQAGSEGKEFASELVKEHAKAQAEEDKSIYRVKIARAYEFAYDMANRGLIPANREAVSAQVDDIMNWNDSAFESYKKVVANHQPILQKAASGVPQVGLTFEDDKQPQAKSDYELLVEAFSNPSNRLRF